MFNDISWTMNYVLQRNPAFGRLSDSVVVLEFLGSWVRISFRTLYMIDFCFPSDWCVWFYSMISQLMTKPRKYSNETSSIKANNKNFNWVLYLYLCYETLPYLQSGLFLIYWNYTNIRNYLMCRTLDNLLDLHTSKVSTVYRSCVISALGQNEPSADQMRWVLTFKVFYLWTGNAI